MDEHVKLEVRAHLDAVNATIRTLRERVDEQFSQVQDAIHVLSNVSDAGATGGEPGGGEPGGGELHEQLDSLDQKVWCGCVCFWLTVAAGWVCFWVTGCVFGWLCLRLGVFLVDWLFVAGCVFS